MDDLKKRVIEEFSSPPAQESYKKKALDGLWESEKILIKKYFPASCKVLDIGCGTGRTTIPLYKSGYKIAGLDITPKMIESAKEIANELGLKIPYIIGDACRIPFKEASFDAALFSCNGWTQIPRRENRQKALLEIKRILVPGGIFIFTSHIRDWKKYKLFWGKEAIKHKILKPMGLIKEGREYGDRLFEKEKSGTSFATQQYIHIPSIDEVLADIAGAGFELEYIEKAENISQKDNLENPPTFFVVRKSKGEIRPVHEE